MRRIFAERNYGLKNKVLPYNRFHLFLDSENGLKINESNFEEIIKTADSYLEKEIPQLLASEYAMFRRNGNRSVFEAKFFNRRHMLMCLTLAEFVDKKGNYIDKLMDLIWLMLEETTWVIPAHNHGYDGKEGSFPLLASYFKDNVEYIDLFSATTGANLAFVYYLLHDELDEVTPLICERILHELNRRLIYPFLDPLCQQKMSWMGLSGNFVNNWNPWIVSNILTVCALTTENTETREDVIRHSMKCLDEFVKFYHEDGGCDEGPGYWAAAGASLFDCLEIMYDMTGGYINLYDDPLVRGMGEYFVKVYVDGNRFLNFADGNAKVGINGRLLYRWGKCCNSEMMRTFGANKLIETYSFTGANVRNYPYRAVRDLVEPEIAREDFIAPTKIWFDGIIIAGTREFLDTSKGLYIALKGGTNAESHNHNDLGTVIVYADGVPIFLDAGSGTYTRRTFSNERYDIWSMRSEYHNCATVNGVLQKNGKEFYSADHVYDDVTGALSMQLKNAYPAEAGIESYIRSAVLDNGMITITDMFELKDVGTVRFHFICNEMPGVVDETHIRIHGRTVEFSDKLSYSVEEIDCTEPEVKKIPRAWDTDAIYRLNLTAKSSFKHETFVLKVK